MPTYWKHSWGRAALGGECDPGLKTMSHTCRGNQELQIGSCNQCSCLGQGSYGARFPGLRWGGAPRLHRQVVVPASCYSHSSAPWALCLVGVPSLSCTCWLRAGFLPGMPYVWMHFLLASSSELDVSSADSRASWRRRPSGADAGCVAHHPTRAVSYRTEAGTRRQPEPGRQPVPVMFPRTFGKRNYA